MKKKKKKKFDVLEIKMITDCKKKKKTISIMPTLSLDELVVIYP
jgi:hypothetical protein